VSALAIAGMQNKIKFSIVIYKVLYVF
jgi:hypothetical protein